MNSECERLSPNLSAYLDGELSSAERTQVQIHLEGCQKCRETAKELEETNQVLKSLFSPDREPEFDLKRVWKNVESQISFRPSVWARFKAWFSRPVHWLPATAAAAVAVIVISVVTMQTKPPSIEMSRIESVFSSTGQVMVLQTPESGRPLIWILPGTAGGGAG